MTRTLLSIAAASLLLSAASCGVKATDTQPASTMTAKSSNSYSWGEWPAGKDPRDVGKKLVQNFLDRTGKGVSSVDYRPKSLIYPEACTAYGCLRFDNSVGDKEQLDALLTKYAAEVGEPGTPGSRMLKPSNEDAEVCAIVPLEMYLITGKEEYLSIGREYADAQFDPQYAADHFKVKSDDYLANPKNGGTHPPTGLSWQTRYWIDDMFMITAVELQAYRATHETKYLDRAALEMTSYLDKLQQPNGLFYHELSVPFYWGRGNGWFAVGMAEMLTDLPENHPQHARILEGYQKMMAALKQFQGPDGSWHQLIDDPTAWGESSCTAMFTFAVAQGVRHGWLDASYKENARKGWIAVTNFLDKDANMTEVCIGTNRKNDRQFYLDRPRESGNFHGQAAAIWAAWSVLDQQ
ncbi:MAG TPA: glycoside hydrolase family 88 protein [Phycisphaerae bacterium]|nr:glycoside hydrolase family 88 protein [Phycisphaerae bacterium]